MKKLLCEREVNEIMETLDGDQRMFLEEHIKQSKRSKWLEMLGERKGIVIAEDMELDEIADRLNDWVLLDILDGGYGNRPYRCECGNSLRFQYIVQHTGTKKTYKLGSTCFEGYTSLSPEVLRDIKYGFYHIDLLRDEMLLKCRKGEFFDITPYLEAGLPMKILQQYLAGLPLTDYQIKHVLFLYNAYKRSEEEREEREKQTKQLESLSLEQREWLKAKFSETECLEILHKLEHEKAEYSIDYLKQSGVDESIISQLELGLPVTTVQEFQINARLRVYHRELQAAKEPNISHEDESTGVKKDISYEEFIFRYGEQLERIRAREDEISHSLRRDWEEVKKMVKALENDGEFSLKRCYLKISNLLASLRI